MNQLARDTLALQDEDTALRDLFDSPSVARQFLLMARSNGFVRQFEARLRLGTGQRSWNLLSARLVDIAGQPTLIVTLIDVHERHQDFEAMRESELRYRRILEAANEGYALFDVRTGELLEVNAALCHMLGYDRDALLRMMPEALVTEDSLPQLEAERKRWANMPHRRFELGLRRATGERITAEISIAGIVDQDGRLSSIFALINDVTARKLNEERVLYLAFYDTLTALPNRFLFAEHTEQALRVKQRQGGMLALMFIDLDDFKLINDTLGHDAGDELLRVVAKRLLACVRASDTVSRQGGDEFMVLLPGIRQVDDARQIAQKMLTALDEPIEVGGEMRSVRASIGISVYPDHGTTASTLRRHADIAMYRAKSEGKHRFAVYTPTEDDVA
ncbi:MAG: GGDEF domain-containing protein [Burkholderiales bacterium]|nr:GGDEF domain-containing protein [Burkholderiales bacterium]